MDRWWNRLVTWVRGTDVGRGGAGTMALVAPRPMSAARADAQPDGNGAGLSGAFLGRRLWGGGRGAERSAAQSAAVLALVDRVTRLCELLERQSQAARARTQDAEGMDSEGSAGFAAAPPLVQEQLRQAENLREMVVLTCQETQKLSVALNDVPATLRSVAETLRHAAGETRQGLAAACQASAAACEKLQSVGAAVEQIGAGAERQSAALTTLLKERRAGEQRLAAAIQYAARRLTVLSGFAIGAAFAAAMIGVIGLIARLPG